MNITDAKLLLIFVAVLAMCYQDVNGTKYSLNEDNYIRSLDTASRTRRNVYTGHYNPNQTCALGVNFTYRYVGSDGAIYLKKKLAKSQPLLQISAAPKVSVDALKVATKIVSLAVKNMPLELFTTMATQHARFGVFTANETLTIFPEYCHLKDTPGCKGTCAGNCSYLCTSDGRKYGRLPGLGGLRSVVVDDSVLCDVNDPYGRQLNLAIHEFGHSVRAFGLAKMNNTSWGKILQTAFKTARANATWEVQSYAMSDIDEYFAEASGVFFHSHQYDTTGGMNRCGKSGQGRCSSEQEAREFLASNDPLLFSVLEYAYTNKNAILASGLKTCMPRPTNSTG